MNNIKRDIDDQIRLLRELKKDTANKLLIYKVQPTSGVFNYVVVSPKGHWARIFGEKDTLFLNPESAEVVTEVWAEDFLRYKNLVGAKLTGEMKSLENGVTLVKVEALASTADVKTVWVDEKYIKPYKKLGFAMPGDLGYPPVWVFAEGRPIALIMPCEI